MRLPRRDRSTFVKNEHTCKVNRERLHRFAAGNHDAVETGAVHGGVEVRYFMRETGLEPARPCGR